MLQLCKSQEIEEARYECIGGIEGGYQVWIITPTTGAPGGAFKCKSEDRLVIAKGNDPFT